MAVIMTLMVIGVIAGRLLPGGVPVNTVVGAAVAYIAFNKLLPSKAANAVPAAQSFQESTTCYCKTSPSKARTACGRS